MDKITVIPTVKVLDIFAGAGGFSLGFKMAGCEVIGAIELDRWACDTFSYNHPLATVIKADISTLSDEDIALYFANFSPDIVIGGPPCQGFSIANRKAGDPRDPRNSLFKDFARIGRILQPRLMVMENVPNLMTVKTNNGALVIDLITETLQNLGYYTYWKVLQATDFGVPQIRNRLFLVASRCDLASPFPEPTHYIPGQKTQKDQLNPDVFQLEPCPMLWDAISDLPELAAKEGNEEQDYVSSPNNKYQRLLRGDCSILYNHKAMNHTKRMVERFSAMKWGHSVNDVPAHLKPRKRNSQQIASSAYDQNNRRMHPEKPCHTIPASFYANFVHPYSDRNFTAREGARIQSFPDSYRFLGKPTVVSHKLLAREGRDEEKYLCQYNQIGNAVPPLLAKAIAKNLLQQIQKDLFSNSKEAKNNVDTRKQFGAERKSSVQVS